MYANINRKHNVEFTSERARLHGGMSAAAQN